MIRETVLSRSIRLICVGGAALGMQAAWAQQPGAQQPGAQEITEPAPAVARVLVTGSRIASPNAESPSPLQVFTAADIAAAGVTNLQELLQKNPALGTPAISRTNSAFSTASAGVATAELRNLGASRTLVLLNGRRYVSGIPGETAVDLNTIPVDFIERVELLTGGASAVYGSDAVAGVVNIITKKNFTGLAVDAQLGQSEEGDDTKKKLSLTFGTSSADGASNVMGHFGYARQGAVNSRDRDRSALDQISLLAISAAPNPAEAFAAVRPFFSSYAPQGRFFHDTGDYTYDAAGNPIPWSTNGSATAAATGFNRSFYRTIAVPVERYLFATTGSLALGANHNAFFEGNYASTRVSTTIEPYPLGAEDIYPGSGGQVPAEFLVGGVARRNPVVPDYLYSRISDTDGDGLRDYYFTRRMAEVGTRGSTADRDTFRLATGLKGDMFGWNYELYTAYGSTKEAQVSQGQVNVLNFRNALEAITDLEDADGDGNTTEALCRDANARAQGCVPINVFGFNTISPAALQYVTAPGSLATRTTQRLFGGSASGEPWTLPAGPLGVAAGFEWRKEFSSAIPDALTQAGLNAGNATPPVAGSYTVREAYVEARAPLYKERPWLHALNLLAAVRVGDYSTVGNTVSWNVGFEWSPIPDVRVRATRALSTRAPNINELFLPPSQDFPSVIDPCIGVGPATAGPTAEACRADPGVAANIAANGVFTLNQADIQGVSGFNSGNPSLSEEEGRSTTIGVVYTPRAIPMLNRFVFTADYFKVDIADAIVPTDRDFALRGCYGGGGPAFCGLITRRPAAVGANSAGSLDRVDTRVTNTGNKGTEGIDLTVAWADQLGPGRLSTRLAWTHLRSLFETPEPGGPRDEDRGEVGSAMNRALLSLGYRMGQWNLTTNHTYIGESALDDSFLTSAGLAPGSVRVDSKFYHDAQLGYKLRKNVELYFGVDNLLDTNPPPILTGLPSNTTGAETDAGTYDAIGRRYYFGLRMSL
ncbi:TonB-dependent receptor plug domain-containing protein [Massilia glaciei]|uniref:TonB-dependent receptor n=1 Tax=Massilia glaciei TaxID=1524097 RepID=A0A2U2HF06_9BURK|nr:TonB-dependent receptor [Massilia glaciei]PWF42497.1 TonB-dependent receptor [Massilia glaciei]